MRTFECQLEEEYNEKIQWCLDHGWKIWNKDTNEQWVVLKKFRKFITIKLV